jgi:hypothetical protein
MEAAKLIRKAVLRFCYLRPIDGKPGVRTRNGTFLDPGPAVAPEALWSQHSFLSKLNLCLYLK